MSERGELLEKVLISGDLKGLTAEERVRYYHAVCESLSLNPLTRPFEYIILNNQLKLYAKRECCEQLRRRDKISVTIVARELVEGVYIVTARATTPDGRFDESIGAVSLEGLKGDLRSNAMMRGETKAKRRVTLSICGLGLLDETEVGDIPDARVPEPAPPLPAPPPAPKPKPNLGPPQTAAELEARLQAFDSRGAKSGRWERGECVEYVRRVAVEEEGQPEDFALWDGAILRQAMELAMEFARNHPHPRIDSPQQPQPQSSGT